MRMSGCCAASPRPSWRAAEPCPPTSRRASPGNTRDQARAGHRTNEARARASHPGRLLAQAWQLELALWLGIEVPDEVIEDFMDFWQQARAATPFSTGGARGARTRSGARRDYGIGHTHNLVALLQLDGLSLHGSTPLAEWVAGLEQPDGRFAAQETFQALYRELTPSWPRVGTARPGTAGRSRCPARRLRRSGPTPTWRMPSMPWRCSTPSTASRATSAPRSAGCRRQRGDGASLALTVDGLGNPTAIRCPTRCAR